MRIVYSARCLEYEQPGHPESPERVKGIAEALRGRHGFEEPSLASERDLLRVHSREMLVRLEGSDPGLFNADSPHVPGIYERARLSAGGAVMARDLALAGEGAFSLMRPPGHHAGPDYIMGFCYLNSMAVAAAGAMECVGRLAVLDIDCHHGNGTQDILQGRDRALFVSIHQSPLYPFRGLSHEQNCRNYPVSPGTDEAGYLEALDKAIEDIRGFGPDLLGVSAGFDAHEDDPITSLGLRAGSYREIGRRIAGLGVPTFSVLEGGYGKALPRCVTGYLEGLESQG